jgi:enterochelin esterase-like enzyme
MRYRQASAALLACAIGASARLLARDGVPVDEHLVPSRSVPAPGKVLVLTPPSYAAGAPRRYPVLLALHDGQGDERFLLKRGTAAALRDEMARGALREMVIVCPRGVGTWFADSYDGAVRYTRFLAEELVPFVEAHYRVIPERSARAAAGISMGGFGALRSGLTRPDLFAVVGGLSPAVQQLSWRTVQTLPFFIRPSFHRVFGKEEKRNNLRESDLYDMLLRDPTLAGRAPEVLLRCGTEDRWRLGQITAFLKRFLDALRVRNELVLEPGGHDWTYWRRALPELIRAVAARLPAPA